MSFKFEPHEAPSMLVRRTTLVVYVLSLVAMAWSASFSAFLIAMKPSAIVPHSLQLTLLISWLLAVADCALVGHLMKKTPDMRFDDRHKKGLRMIFRCTLFVGAFPLVIMACHDITFVF